MNLNQTDLACSLLSEGHGVLISAGGSSMLPFIRHCDLLALVPVSPAQLRIGDIVLARRNKGGAVIHRIVDLPSPRAPSCKIAIRGDAGSDQVERVSPAAILGRVVSIVRPDGELRLDRGLRHAAGRLWARTQPVGHRLMRLGLTLGRKLPAHAP